MRDHKYALDMYLPGGIELEFGLARGLIATSLGQRLLDQRLLDRRHLDRALLDNDLYPGPLLDNELDPGPLLDNELDPDLLLGRRSWLGLSFGNR